MHGRSLSASHHVSLLHHCSSAPRHCEPPPAPSHRLSGSCAVAATPPAAPHPLPHECTLPHAHSHAGHATTLAPCPPAGPVHVLHRVATMGPVLFSSTDPTRDASLRLTLDGLVRPGLRPSHSATSSRRTHSPPFRLHLPIFIHSLCKVTVCMPAGV